MIVVNFKDPARGFIRVPGDKIVYENMATEEFIHLYNDKELCGVIRRDAIDSVAVDVRESAT